MSATQQIPESTVSDVQQQQQQKPDVVIDIKNVLQNSLLPKLQQLGFHALYNHIQDMDLSHRLDMFKSETKDMKFQTNSTFPQAIVTSWEGVQAECKIMLNLLQTVFKQVCEYEQWYYGNLDTSSIQQQLEHVFNILKIRLECWSQHWQHYLAYPSYSSIRQKQKN